MKAISFGGAPNFAEQPVRVKFRWVIPECFAGPGFFQLDNVLINVIPSTPVNESTWAGIKSVYR